MGFNPAKLEVLENQFPNEDDLDQIYASQTDEEKENSRRIIKSNLQSDFNNNLLRIKATLESPSQIHDYPHPRPSGLLMIITDTKYLIKPFTNK